jgi:polyhydroxyalkanoate synthesis regulator phasin
MQSLNRQEIEDYVIDLYHHQKKTFREIQKLVRKSPRDIRAILDKVEPERASLSVSSRAYHCLWKAVLLFR